MAGLEPGAAETVVGGEIADLVPLVVDPVDPASTGLPVEWFRQQVADCKADFKLLVLDACHAGSEKGEDGAKVVPSKDIGA